MLYYTACCLSTWFLFPFAPKWWCVCLRRLLPWSYTVRLVLIYSRFVYLLTSPACSTLKSHSPTLPGCHLFTSLLLRILLQSFFHLCLQVFHSHYSNHLLSNIEASWCIGSTDNANFSFSHSHFTKFPVFFLEAIDTQIWKSLCCSTFIYSSLLMQCMCVYVFWKYMLPSIEEYCTGCQLCDAVRV